MRFVPPEPSGPYYEVSVFDSGCVYTRPENAHDLFNALAWLAFPLTKARINALHAKHIAREPLGRRGRFRDLLTLFDEGGAVVRCSDATLVQLVKAHRWKELFCERRDEVQARMQVAVLGHAVLEQAINPWPGITCKTIFVPTEQDVDAQAAAWLDGLPDTATPRDMASLPIFGYPGWFPGSDDRSFYDDARYFRPLARDAR